MPSSNRRHVVVSGDLAHGYTFYGPYYDPDAARMDADSLADVHELLSPSDARNDLLTVFACLLDTLGLRSFSEESLSRFQELGLTIEEVSKYMLMATKIHRESRRT